MIDFWRSPEPLRSDEDYMRAALALGRRGMGRTAENPSVGALVVRDGIIVGRGWTQDGGRPHAEPMALAEAGEAARGATLYVTLEPCSHHGRTPPCAEAIVAAGIARVVSAMEDPDMRVAGRGHALLRTAGIETIVGVCADEARRANRGHTTFAREGRAAVTLKLAETLDGYAAGGPHDPRLSITSAPANGVTHVMRAMHDAIMVGAGTARIDDPLMTVRAPGLDDARPLRVVLDARLALSRRSRLAASVDRAPALVLTDAKADAVRREALLAAGVETQNVKLTDNGRIDLRAALALLGARGLRRIFSEGGPRVGAALIAGGLADDVVIFTAPKPLGRRGAAALDDDARATLADPARYRMIEDAMIGPDRMRRYERIG
ncbi:MAG: bifunctional diaminohydroxyphosphoribosylaminopyrimidine deaminase/5-amino-6-(5-phosphoribosylamino)uracil reductase RibD [Hyphomicrobiales bacterium]|nr:bifunctional diaminohydroxyphosphoribosylaminopyrimidine deaminase/5-amino-6-(5-phosphoribosylamino)uracil reductase RibD [Hyphomicrobiales bacterium]